MNRIVLIVVLLIAVAIGWLVLMPGDEPPATDPETTAPATEGEDTSSATTEDAAQSAAEEVANAAASAVTAATEAANTAASAIGEAVNQTQDAAEEAAAQISESASTAQDTVTAAVDQAVTSTNEAISSRLGDVRAAFEDNGVLTEEGFDYDAAVALVEESELATGIKDQINRLLAAIRDSPDTISTNLATLKETLGLN